MLHKHSIAFVLFTFVSVAAFGQQPGQRTFASPENAGRAFFDAMQSEAPGSFLSIFGPAGKGILSSGDPVEDLDARVSFVLKYQEMHRFATEPNGKVSLIVGAENWPFPIPLVNNQGRWYFETLAGKSEILFRRIGKNEQAAIEACRDLVEAQKEYFSNPPGAQPKQYAARLVSDDGGYNGLYWKDTDNEFDSPLNPLIAFASGQDARDGLSESVPFNGYFFRVLTKRGPHARGGAGNYIVDGKMTAGFAFVAYPVQHRSSGVMTFIVSDSGNIYEKDLGPNTTKLAEAMTAFDPDSTWQRVK